MFWQDDKLFGHWNGHANGSTKYEEICFGLAIFNFRGLIMYKAVFIVLVSLLLASIVHGQEKNSIDFRYLHVVPAAPSAPVLENRFYGPTTEWTDQAPEAYWLSISAIHGSLEVEEKLLLGVLDGDMKTLNESEVTEAMSLYDRFREPMHQLAISLFKEIRRTESDKDKRFWNQKHQDARVAKDIAYLMRLRIERSDSLRERVSLISDGIRLAEYIGRGESLVDKLTGSAIQGLMFETVLSTIERFPDVNFYWSLGTIPRPLVSYRHAVSAAMRDLATGFAELELDKLQEERFDNDYWLGEYRKMFRHFKRVAGTDANSPKNVDALIELSIRNVEEFKLSLVELGYERACLDRMPAAQVILLDARESLKRIAQDYERLALADSKDIEALAAEQARLESEFEKKEKVKKSPALIWFLLVRPDVAEFIRSELQVERRVSQLLVLEAIRWHAAIHGVLPTDLDELSLFPEISDQIKEEVIYTFESIDKSKQTFSLVDSKDLGKSRFLGLNVTVEFDQSLGKRDKR